MIDSLNILHNIGNDLGKLLADYILIHNSILNNRCKIPDTNEKLSEINYKLTECEILAQDLLNRLELTKINVN